MAEPDRAVRLVLTPVSAALRRRLGPTAWTVLEDVLLHGEAADTAVVATSVRAVADRLGLSRTTAGRALASLVERGLLSRRQQRDGCRGTFGPATYECRLDQLDGVDLVTDVATTERSTTTRTRHRRTDHQQHPTLFTDDNDSSEDRHPTDDTDRYWQPDDDERNPCTHGHPQVPGQRDALPRGAGRC